MLKSSKMFISRIDVLFFLEHLKPNYSNAPEIVTISLLGTSILCPDEGCFLIALLLFKLVPAAHAVKILSLNFEYCL